MERLERRADHFPATSSFPSDDRQQHLHGGYHHHHDYGEQNDFAAYQLNCNSNYTLPLPGQKRQFSHSSYSDVDYGGFVKLYVVGIPRTATEQDIGAVFGEHGHIVEIVLLKDKKTGLQQECCFVKYATVEQAEQAIGTLHGHFIFPGGMIPIKVKYAVGERERLGSFGAHVHKLYVGCLNRQALKWDIEEIFSPFGIIEEIFIVRDEFKQNRGCAFVQYSCRDMAIAAIEALHGAYVMRGCDQPLIVRFADPKKPRVDSRPAPHPNDPSSEHMMSNEMQQLKSPQAGCKTTTVSSTSIASAAHALNSSNEMEHYMECDWSEHVSPDGDLYYYNCVTCESRWEKPVEYELYEQEVDNLEQQEREQEESKLPVSCSPEVSQLQLV